MLSNQIELKLSDYSDLYDLVIPKNHILREIKEMVDFFFFFDELENKYCLINGRNAKNPILMFKYLFLKCFYNLSDAGVVERSRYDLSFKYFLDLTPEEEVIHPSLLTKFRKQRLKDKNILDLLIRKSVELAMEAGVLKSKTVIIDSTHTQARYNKQSIRGLIVKEAAKLCDAVKKAGSHEDLPETPDRRSTTDESVAYSKELLNIVRNSACSELPGVKEHADLLDELLQDDADAYDYSNDPDARIGHKSATGSFYGYKTHIAMSDERIITAATITSGEAFDGTELPELVAKTRKNGMEIETVIADTAYSTLENLKEAKSEKFNLVSKLNPCITKGMRPEDGFYYNKDAETMQCPAGNLATKKRIVKRTKKNSQLRYLFDIEKCKSCPKRDGCYKEGSKTKSYCVTIKSDYHAEQEAFQKTDDFKKILKNRYKIEAKNSELKNIHGYDKCESAGLDCMKLQGAVSIFAVNLKRILKLKGGVCPDSENHENF